MTTSAKIAIPLTILIPVCIAIMGWQWNLQGRVTKTETQVENVREDLHEIKYLINRNYLMNSRRLDSIADDVQEVNANVKPRKK